jgi:hypothetical protein
MKNMIEKAYDGKTGAQIHQKDGDAGQPRFLTRINLT